MRQRRLNAEGLALAYELRGAGVQWKLIGYGLGLNHEYIHHQILRAERHGIAHLISGRGDAE